MSGCSMTVHQLLGLFMGGTTAESVAIKFCGLVRTVEQVSAEVTRRIRIRAIRFDSRSVHLRHKRDEMKQTSCCGL